MAAWVGEAQTDALPALRVTCCVKRYGVVAAKFDKEIDGNHIAAQVMMDILDSDEPLPAHMRKNPHGCKLILCIDGHRQVLDIYERLNNYRERITGTHTVLEVMEKGADVQDDEYHPEDMGLNQRN